ELVLEALAGERPAEMFHHRRVAVDGHVQVEVTLLEVPQADRRRRRGAAGRRRGLPLRHIVADSSLTKIPMRFPSVSLYWAEEPPRGPGALSDTSSPPASTIFVPASSIDSTLMVSVVSFISPRWYSAPSMPRSDSSPVVASP